MGKVASFGGKKAAPFKADPTTRKRGGKKAAATKKMRKAAKSY